MREHHDKAVIVSPVSTLRHILMVSVFRALIGMIVTVWLIGPEAAPILIPGVTAAIAHLRAGRTLSTQLYRLGLCLSSSMWIGAAAAFVYHDTTGASIFLAAVITTFAVTDIMLSTMRMERIA